MKFEKLLMLFAAMMVLLLSCDLPNESGDEDVEPVVAEKYKQIYVPVITSPYLIVK